MQITTQSSLVIEALKEKSIDVMKKSTTIYGLLQKYDMNVGSLSQALFTDALFRAGTLGLQTVAMLNQASHLSSSSKKLEQFLVGRIEKKVAELNTAALIESMQLVREYR